MNFEPAHLCFINLLTEQTGLTMHFFAFYPVDRSIEVRIGELEFQGRFFFVPLRQLPLKLLNLFDQRPPLGE